MSFHAVAQSFKVDHTTVGEIVDDVCKAIYNRFVWRHLAVPTIDGFKKIASEFERRWQFPNAIGCLDGKHVEIKCPPQAGSMFYNYKKFHSINLQAVADAKCRFLFIDVGGYGRQHDAGVYYHSNICDFIENDENFPPHQFIEGNVIEPAMPFTFLADDAYPLRTRIMKPYDGIGLSNSEKIFNGRLSRARICVERAFGILVSKWRIFLKPIETSLKKAENIVKCACLLQNIIIDKEGINIDEYKNYQCYSKKLVGVKRARANNHSSVDAEYYRKKWTDYFVSSAGSIPNQERYLRKYV